MASGRITRQCTFSRTIGRSVSSLGCFIAILNRFDAGDWEFVHGRSKVLITTRRRVAGTYLILALTPDDDIQARHYEDCSDDAK